MQLDIRTKETYIGQNKFQYFPHIMHIKRLIDQNVNIKTINGIEYINCYKPEYFYINDNKISKDVLIAFTKFDNDINCLLNGLLFN